MFTGVTRAYVALLSTVWFQTRAVTTPKHLCDLLLERGRGQGINEGISDDINPGYESCDEMVLIVFCIQKVAIVCPPKTQDGSRKVTDCKQQ